ncbi:4-hydroxy-2-oxovalerate aldolase [Actinoplanes sp. N902-109]|nr:4-hydroxy-2-oxovalerate aldolase [Actinoplanes sp. N902-109]
MGIDSPALTEMMSVLGFDFLLVDLEHGAVTETTLVQHVMAARVPVLARLADSSEVAVKRGADTGVDAIVVPHVQSGAAAADIVRWAKYPPVGGRSLGLSRNTLLGYGLADAMKDAAKPVVIAQIEDAAGVADVASICRTPGIDSVFIGPYDLSASLGEAGNFETGAFLTAVERVVTAAGAQGITVGVFAPTPQAWRRFRDLGCQYVVLSSDSLLLADGARRALDQVRAE